MDGRRPPRGRHPRHAAHRRADRHLHPARDRRAHLRHQGPRRLHAHRRRAPRTSTTSSAPPRTATPSTPSSAPRSRPRRPELTAGEPVEVSLHATSSRSPDGHPDAGRRLHPRPPGPAARPRRADRRGRRGRPAPPTRPSSWSPPPTASSPRASTARTCACPAARTTWSAPSPPPTRTPSWSSTPAPRWNCPGARTSPPCCSAGSPARRAAPPSPTSSPAPHEPGGRLPTTWGSLTDAPVTQVVPGGRRTPLHEGVFIGYRAWEKQGRGPVVPLRPRPRLHRVDLRVGQGRRAPRSRSASATPATAPAARSSRSTSPRPSPTPPARRAGWPASRASRPGPARRAEASVDTAAPRLRDLGRGRPTAWAFVKGSYEIQVSRSIADRRITATINV